jgi:hypothetical protein
MSNRYRQCKFIMDFAELQLYMLMIFLIKISSLIKEVMEVSRLIELLDFVKWELVKRDKILERILI